MRTVTILAILLSAALPGAAAQTRPTQKAEPDRLGMSCAQILAMSSTDWVAHFNDKLGKKAGNEKKTNPEITVRALAVYGQCYDARTNRLVASLAKRGKGPLMGARGNFRDFEQAVDEFVANALAATNPPADDVKRAFAALYKKQFRYLFYQPYEPKKSNPTAASVNKPAEPASPPIAASPASQPPQDLAVSEMTKAKNRFGELLDALPEDKLREIHKSFGRIFSGGPVSDEMKLEVYRYAIFVLEPRSATPFSPPSY